ncbi:hypothetical protein BKA70DRAFT_1308358 [Coprinopsis sp. MPI-PUGE-AT-0042]|nr:hypothetical protein BKA70DRAFT_1308358 [Coprinopsis sp. MPI-PUGE-AT-0042]
MAFVRLQASLDILCYLSSVHSWAFFVWECLRRFHCAGFSPALLALLAESYCQGRCNQSCSTGLNRRPSMRFKQ